MTDFDSGPIGPPDVTIPEGNLLLSDIIAYEPASSLLNVTSVIVSVNFSGSIVFDITGNSNDTTPTWDTITLIPNTPTTKVLTVPGKSVQYRILGFPGTNISSIKNSVGNIVTPAISITLNYV